MNLNNPNKLNSLNETRRLQTPRLLPCPGGTGISAGAGARVNPGWQHQNSRP